MAAKYYTFEIINNGVHEVRTVKAESEEEAKKALPEGCTIKTAQARN